MTVHMFSLKQCPFCDKAKRLLESKGVEYTASIIGVDLTREEFKEMYPDARTAPYIIMNGEVLGGYTELEKYYAVSEQSGTGSST